MQEELKVRIREARKYLEDLEKALDREKLEADIRKIQDKMSSSDFWQEPQEAKRHIQQLKRAKSILEPYLEIRQRVQDLEELSQLSEDEKYLRELLRESQEIIFRLKNLKISVLLDGEFDNSGAILTINSGAGGVDACDWANMLLRMYTRWAEDKGYRVKLTDILYDQEAGIKNATLFIDGVYAYGYLKSETGVHRLVRISPFDANKRRHTSFASVEVIPQIEEDIEVSIRDEDLKIETFRASGPGGQHVNVTDSAVRITHLPTGIVVQCQNERSQYQNKQTAFKILKARLFELERYKMREKLKELSSQKMRIEWGSQIRSYILHPYTMVKDHRTGLELYDVSKVLDGYIDPFIEAYLLSSKNV